MMAKLEGLIVRRRGAVAVESVKVSQLSSPGSSFQWEPVALTWFRSSREAPRAPSVNDDRLFLCELFSILPSP